LVNLTKCPFSDQFENLEIIGAKMFLVHFRKMHADVNLARDVFVLGAAGLESEPSFQGGMLLSKIQTQPDMAQKCLSLAIIDRHV
jgi:hypothetical protein